MSTPTVRWCLERISKSGFPTSPRPTTTTGFGFTSRHLDLFRENDRLVNNCTELNTSLTVYWNVSRTMLDCWRISHRHAFEGWLCRLVNS